MCDPQVFFSVMIGAFSLGQGAPNLESVAKARGAAYAIYNTIDMVLPSLNHSIFEWQKWHLTSNESLWIMIRMLHSDFSPSSQWFISVSQPRPIDSSSKEGYKPDSVRGDIEFKNIYFSYPSRKDVKVKHLLKLWAVINCKLYNQQNSFYNSCCRFFRGWAWRCPMGRRSLWWGLAAVGRAPPFSCCRGFRIQMLGR